MDARWRLPLCGLEGLLRCHLAEHHTQGHIARTHCQEKTQRPQWVMWNGQWYYDDPTCIWCVLATAGDVPCPAVILDYNRYMGGVDLFDQMGSVYAILRKTFCWPIVFFYNFLETAVHNSYLLYKVTTNPKVWFTWSRYWLILINVGHQMTHRKYVRLLVEELTAAAASSHGLCGSRGGRPTIHGGELGYIRPVHHLPATAKSSARGRQYESVSVSCCILTDTCLLCRCAVCKFVDKRRTLRLTYCKECKVYLCLFNNDNCYDYYHSKAKNAIECRKKVDQLRKDGHWCVSFVRDEDIIVKPSRRWHIFSLFYVYHICFHCWECVHRYS